MLFNSYVFVLAFFPIVLIGYFGLNRFGSAEMQKEGYQNFCEMLSGYNNVRLFLWTDDQMFEIMSNLDHYVDEAHYGPEVCSEMARRIKLGEGLLTRENYKEEVDKFFDYIYSFGYDSLFE